MSVSRATDILDHAYHKLEVVWYGNPPVNAAIECETCSEVLLDYDVEDGEQIEAPQVTAESFDILVNKAVDALAKAVDLRPDDMSDDDIYDLIDQAQSLLEADNDEGDRDESF